ncbi:MAG: hypothetical protein BIFFINMI_01468 [Phycisphaerae bacterium]|nr:hypothetical protein [Phycisphaerae bacterium]
MKIRRPQSRRPSECIVDEVRSRQRLATVAAAWATLCVCCCAVVAAPPPKPLPNILGNGVVVNPDGHVLTPAHLVAGRGEVALIVHGKREVAKFVAADAALDLAVFKLPGQGYARATFADSDRSHKDDNLCLLGGVVKHNTGKLFTQGDVALFPRFGPVSADQRKNVLTLNGPANPGLDGAVLFDCHGDVVGLFNARLTDHPWEKACALDIRAAAAFLTANKIPFTTGGAPMEHSLDDILRSAAASVVTFAPAEFPQMWVEYPLPDGPVAGLRKSISFLGGGSTFSPDGQKIAVVRHLGSGSTGRSEIILLDSATGKEEATLTGQAGGVRLMRFSPDGKFLLAATAMWTFGGLQGKTVVWNMEKGAAWFELPPADDAAYSSDGKLIALRVGPRDKSWRLDNKLSNTVEMSIHDAADGKLVAQVVPGKHQLVGELYQCLFMPRSGELLTVGLWLNKQRNEIEVLHLWDPKTGELVKALTPDLDPDQLKHGYAKGRASVSPDEKTLVLDGYSGKDMAAVYDFPSCRRRYTLPNGPSDARQTLGSLFSPDGASFALRSGQFTSRHMRLYDVASGTCFWMFYGEWDAAFSPDGHRMMLTSNSGIVVWDLPHE